MSAPIEKSANLLATAAGLSLPWRFVKWRVDINTNAIHIWVTKLKPIKTAEVNSAWFGLRKVHKEKLSEPPAVGLDQCWRHIDALDFTFYVHTTDELSEQDHQLAWFGQPGTPFTNQLSRKIFIGLSENLNSIAICQMFGIQSADLSKFKLAIDSGLYKFGYKAAGKTQATALANPTNERPVVVEKKSTALPLAAIVPSMHDPIWEGLLLGSVNIKIKALSFQLILTKLRQQVRLHNFDEIKVLKMRELHRYVERNQKSLAFELQLITELNAQRRLG